MYWSRITLFFDITITFKHKSSEIRQNLSKTYVYFQTAKYTFFYKQGARVKNVLFIRRKRCKPAVLCVKNSRNIARSWFKNKSNDTKNPHCAYKTIAYTLSVPLHWGVISTHDCILRKTFEYFWICTVP